MRIDNPIFQKICLILVLVSVPFMYLLMVNIYATVIHTNITSLHIDFASDHIFGDTKARIAMVEYSDLECPFCKDFQTSAHEIMNTYKGRVFWVYRAYPLRIHLNAQKEAEAAECVAHIGGNEKFWSFIDTIYARTTSNGIGFALNKLAPLAKEIGVNEKSFNTCLDSGKFSQTVKDQEASGIKQGVTGTPGIFLADTKTSKKIFIPGDVAYDQIRSMISDMLK